MKKLFVSFFLLFLVLAGSFLLVYSQRDTLLAKARPYFERQLEAALGAAVQYEEMSLEVFPSPRVNIRSVSFNSNLDHANVSVQVQQLQAVLRLKPLLSGTIEVASLNVVQPQVVMSKRKEGSGRVIAPKLSAPPMKIDQRIKGEAVSEGVIARENQNSEVLPPVQSSGVEQGQNAAENVQTLKNKGLPIFSIDTIRVQEGSFTAEGVYKEKPCTSLKDISILGALNSTGETLRIEGLSVKGDCKETGLLALEAGVINLSLITDTFSSSEVKVTTNEQSLEFSVQGNLQTQNLTVKLKDSPLALRYSGLPKLLQSLVKAPDFKLVDVAMKPSGILVFGKDSLTGELNLKLEDLVASFKGMSLSKGKANVLLDLGRKKVRVSAGEILAGDALVLGADATVDLNTFDSEVNLRAPKGNAESVRKIVELFVELPAAYAVDGVVGVESNLRFSRAGFSGVKAQVELPGNAIKLGSNKLEKIQGKVDYSYSSSTNAVSLKNVKVYLPQSDNSLSLAGLYDITKQRGDFTLKGSKLPVAALKRELSTFSPAISIVADTGFVSSDVRLRVSGTEPEVRGSLSFENLGVALGQVPITKLSSNLNLSSQAGQFRADSSSMSFNLNGQAVSSAIDGRYSPKGLQLNLDKGAGFGGTFEGAVDYDPARGSLRTSGALRKVDLFKLLGAIHPPAAERIQGKIILARGDVRGPASAGFAEGLAGPADILIEDGLIRGVHLGRMILDKVASVPIIGRNIIRDIPEEFHQHFQGEDTKIVELRSKLNFRAGVLEVSDLFLRSDVYVIQGNGTVSLKESGRFRGRIRFDAGLSEALVRKVKELKLLLTPESLLAVPFELRGAFPNVQVYPDVEGLLSKGAGQVINDLLGDVLGRIGEKQKPRER